MLIRSILLFKFFMALLCHFTIEVKIDFLELIKWCLMMMLIENARSRGTDISLMPTYHSINQGCRCEGYEI